MRRAIVRTVAVAVTAAVAIGTASVANATFPGSNGDWAYRAGRPGDAEYRIFVGDGLTEKAVTPDGKPAGSPNWRPDGKRIAFTMSADIDSRSDVWVMRPNGKDKRRLTRTPNRFESAPAFSPDGTWIAFVRGEANVMLMRADGSGERSLVKLRGEVYSLSWSPDGRWIATQAFRGGTIDIVRIAVSTGKKRWVTATPEFEFTPDWSPDGRRILFSRDVGDDQDLFTIRPDGTRERRLTTTTDHDESQAVWSPDGTAVLFVQRTIATNVRDLAVMAAVKDAPSTAAAWPGDDFDPAWQSLP